MHPSTLALLKAGNEIRRPSWAANKTLFLQTPANTPGCTAAEVVVIEAGIRKPYLANTTEADRTASNFIRK